MGPGLGGWWWWWWWWWCLGGVSSLRFEVWVGAGAGPWGQISIWALYGGVGLQCRSRYYVGTKWDTARVVLHSACCAELSWAARAEPG
jgi:hypothetical protein